MLIPRRTTRQVPCFSTLQVLLRYKRRTCLRRVTADSPELICSLSLKRPQVWQPERDVASGCSRPARTLSTSGVAGYLYGRAPIIARPTILKHSKRFANEVNRKHHTATSEYCPYCHFSPEDAVSGLRIATIRSGTPDVTAKGLAIFGFSTSPARKDSNRKAPSISFYDAIKGTDTSVVAILHILPGCAPSSSTALRTRGWIDDSGKEGTTPGVSITTTATSAYASQSYCNRTRPNGTDTRRGGPDSRLLNDGQRPLPPRDAAEYLLARNFSHFAHRGGKECC